MVAPEKVKKKTGEKLRAKHTVLKSLNMVLDTRTVDYLWHIFNKSLNSTGGMNTMLPKTIAVLMMVLV